MTNYGPTQGPSDPPAWSPPPTNGQAVGPPIGQQPSSDYPQLAGYGTRRGSTFDVKSVHPLDWIAMGSALLALIFSFFAYFTYTAKAAETRTECRRLGELPAQARSLARDLCNGASASAWHGFFGWFGVLLGLLAAGLVAVAVFVRQGTAITRTRQFASGGAALAVLSTLIALAVVPDWPALKSYAASVGGSYSSSQYDKNISNGHGFSYWVVLILLVVLAVVTFLQLRNTATPTAPEETHHEAYGPPTTYGAPPAGYQATWQAPPPQQQWTPPPSPPGTEPPPPPGDRPH